MPYYNEEALLPLPHTPAADGFRRALSLFQEVITDTIDIEEEEDAFPPPVHE